ncbi:Nitroreductase [Lophiostoma macrostomum CBS 122681]|uniref:Nitroreductase n=1 Tax=Lophiostoma macrostomum CBS 122681 TaxID=1314788 RepID=A0A6A6TDJ2_9PLEO|nr:Nitroreductase [Lophiostoma macrostomum CBS 122681]
MASSSASPSTSFLTAVQSRRSIYTIKKSSPIPDARIVEIVQHALKYAPSPFNVRSCRCIVLFGADHEKLWNEAYKITEATMPPAAMEHQGPRIKQFGKGYGTVLFFDDSTAYQALSPRFQALSKTYTEWEEHSSGMHQFIVWTALTQEGLGASLQHYQPSVTGFVRQTWNVPETWSLKAQLVFGELTEGPGAEKPKTGLEEALRVFGGDV